MNHTSILYKGAVLAIATAALIGKAALAEDLSPGDTDESSTNIVLAKAATTVNQADGKQTSSSNYADDSGVAEALEGILADSKIELEIRLLGHKSLILTADL